MSALVLLMSSAWASDKPGIFVQLGHSGVQPTAFSADGKWIMSGGDKTVKLRDAVAGAHTCYAAAVAFSTGERLFFLATGINNFQFHCPGNKSPPGLTGFGEILKKAEL